MNAQIARGAGWMLLLRLFDRGIGVVSTAVLARLLLPADFGLVAMAMSVIAVVELATAFSFDVALIQMASPRRAHFDSAWTLNILTGLFGASVVAALAVPAAAFYGDARLVPVMLVIAAGWFIAGFENIGTVDFRRRMDFAAEFRLLAGKRLVAFVVTMVAVLMLRSYWALVIGTVASRLAGVALSYWMAPYRPRLSLAERAPLIRFSVWMLVNNLVGVVASRLPHVVVGRLYGAQPLGAYTLASEVAQLAHTDLVAPINRALFPGYSRLLADSQALRGVLLGATGVIAFLVLPLSAGVALLAAPIVRILLGPQWLEAVPVMQVLAPAGALTALASNNVSACLALGRPQRVTWVVGARLLAFALAVAALAAHGVRAVAWAELAGSAAALVVSLPLLRHDLRLRLRDWLGGLWRPAVASAGMAGVMGQVLALAGPGAGFGDAWLQLLAGGAAGAATYLALSLLLWRLAGCPAGAERLLLEQLRRAAFRQSAGTPA